MEQPQAASGAAGRLDSLRYYDDLRSQATNVRRFAGSNVDQIPTTTANNETETSAVDQDVVSLCHLSTFLPFTEDKTPLIDTHESMASVLLAVAHLITGDGSVVPQVQGLNERCHVRFTTEFADTEYSEGVALQQLIEQVNRDNLPGGANALEQRRPCAFIGEDRSAVSIPMSIVTGIFGYPQISGGSTSVSLDDKSQFPLFGRSVPSDAGTAIPTIIYLRRVMQIQHLAVINVNDAYGNNYVEGMRSAAAEHAPDMIIHQIPLDENNQQVSVASTVQNLKATGYRFVFTLIFTRELHDALLTEAYEQGVAGTGVHNWLFADSFTGTLDGRTFAQDSALHLAYRGAGLLEVSGGVPGVMASFDVYATKMAELLQTPSDVQYMASLFPKHDHPNYPDAPPFINEPDYLNPIVNGFAPFYYEAAIALGLAACDAANNNKNVTITGPEHFDAFRATEFDGVSGHVMFDPITGTRDPSSATYRAVNFVAQPADEDDDDEDSEGSSIRFNPVITELFQQGEWVRQQDYIFNDGTTMLPADLPPPPPAPTDSNNWVVVIVVPIVVVTVVMGVIVFLFYENKRKQNDSVWKIQKDELVFSDPPEIIGQGTFGCVYLAEYRGTEVAVKRAIPPRKSSIHNKKSSGISNDKDRRGTSTVDGMSVLSSAVTSNDSNNDAATTSATTSAAACKPNNIGSTSWAGASLSGVNFAANGTGGTGANPLMSQFRMKQQAAIAGNKRQTEAANRKAMRQDFVQEMRHLSKLRHPCVTTIMGAVTGKSPMIVMEYMELGSLYDILHNETMVIEGELLVPILRDISQGLRFLHSADPQVVHGDLKSANILVDSKFRAKVADFGLTQKKNLGGTGTPFWMAPELLRQESANSAATDVFSFGIILFEVYSRRDPYEDENPVEVLKLVADKSVRKRPPAPRLMPDNIKSLMTDCVEDDAEKRPTFEEINMRVKRIDAEGAEMSRNTSKTSPSSISLFDIFPRHIAEALRDGRTVEAEHRELVTIFFSDIVGFTTISSELDPRKVAALLDRLYTKLDALSRKHDVFKVETIGDAYMCASNLIKDQDDHVKRIAEFSIEAIAAANETAIDLDDPSKGVVNIRVGFHSGPVVADVVGTRSPRYCLFGDAVNTASRMESNSEVNRIHCSLAAAKLLTKQCPTMPLRSRGKINIKGKGLLHTYWVNEDGGGDHPQLRSGSFSCSPGEFQAPPPPESPLLKTTSKKFLQPLVEAEEGSESCSEHHSPQNFVERKKSLAPLTTALKFLQSLVEADEGSESCSEHHEVNKVVERRKSGATLTALPEFAPDHSSSNSQDDEKPDEPRFIDI